MVNENYEPSANDEKVLDALKNGRDEGNPWGRANPRYLVDKTSLDKGNVEFSLRSLRNAGWIQRVARGLYEFVDDPREGDPDES
ncbi:ArsR family transcriptional regulator [Haloferax namakaokahaiae]|uniref:ArsR family transcriptional regulator n=1 Tax=Haloferax namakaokahaiae TaxID=1748331 RepID=A0ABD5ZCW7_9EURY